MTDRVARAVGTLAKRSASLAWEDIPEPVRDRTRMVVYDTLGVMIAGAKTEEMRALASHYTETGSSPLVGFDRYIAIEASCLVNGASVCSLELDEGSKYARGHPAAHTIPAALAVGAGHSGATWLAAVLVGYEVAARFGRATRLSRGVHPHGTWGATGAAAATARLVALDVDGIAAAVDAAAGLTLAPNFVSALSGHPVRNLWVGAANVHGLAATRLAAAGLGENVGTASSTYGDLIGTFDESPLLTPLESRFEIMHGYFKRHASCAYTHAPADAVLELLGGPRFSMGDVETVRVETYAIAAELNRTEWPTRLAAMFSIPYVVAVVLLEGRFDPSASDQDHRTDPDIRHLAEKVTVVATDEFNDQLPDRRGSRVSIGLRDGTERSSVIEQPVGDAAYQPFGWGELRAKVAGLIGASRAETLERAVADLENNPVDALIDILVKA